MQRIRDFTNEELLKQILALHELLDIYEYGSGDYNATESELRVAEKELERRNTKNLLRTGY